MLQLVGILIETSNGLISCSSIQNKPSCVWKLCNINYSLVTTCQKAVNNEHHPPLCWISLQNRCPWHPVYGLYNRVMNDRLFTLLHELACEELLKSVIICMLRLHWDQHCIGCCRPVNPTSCKLAVPKLLFQLTYSA